MVEIVVKEGRGCDEHLLDHKNSNEIRRFNTMQTSKGQYTLPHHFACLL